MDGALSKFATCFVGVIGVISGIIAIKEYLTNNVEHATIWLCIVIISIILFIFLLFLLLNYRFRYSVLKAAKYFFSIPSGKYTEKELKKVYEFLTRENINYYMFHSIRSNVKGLETFTERLRWSKHISVSALKKIMSAPERNQSIIALERINGQMVYTVNIPTLNKGEPLLVKVDVIGLEDEQHESEPYLSASISCKTSKLILTVRAPAEILEDVEAEFVVYQSFQDTVPVIRYIIKYDQDIKGFSRTERWPIIGYRYVIRWRFKQ